MRIASNSVIRWNVRAQVHHDGFAGEPRLDLSRVYGQRTQHLFRQLHHVVVVGVCLVHLNAGELRVMPRRESLVAELLTDLEDTLHAADDQALEHELGRDAHEQVPIERMATCGEWPCLGTTVDVVEDRCLDLDKTT